MVVNKPSGLLSVPGRLLEHKDSIMTRVQELHPEALAVHRLDMDTSGLLIVGLNKQAVSALGKQFVAKVVHKIYLAKVAGCINDVGEVDLPMRADLDNRPLQIIDFLQGKPSLTKYQPLKTDLKTKQSLVALFPITGRSHQLRLHLKEIDHPILGDRFYASDEIVKAANTLNLHASYLEFYHPVTNERLSFISKPYFLTEDEFLLFKNLDKSVR